MKRFIPLGLFALTLTGAAAAVWTPPDIAAYVERRKGCNHFGGEEGYDKARREEINRAVSKLNCNAIDGDEKALLRRYRHAPPQLQQIHAAKDALL
jgi:hypothetical protein